MGESVNVDVDGLASELIHFRTVNPLKLRTRALPLTFYSLFITAMIVIQIVSARLVNRKLTQNHGTYIYYLGMASKLSLFVLSFCTIADLSGTIDFAYRMFQTSVIYNNNIECVLQNNIVLPNCFLRNIILWFRCASADPCADNPV